MFKIKRWKNRAIAVLIAIFAAYGGFFVAGCQSDDSSGGSIVIQPEQTPVKYTYTVKSTAKAKYKTLLKTVAKDVYGVALPSEALVEKGIEQFVSSCENRSVSAENFTALTDAICADAQPIITAVKQEGSGVVNAVAASFGNAAAICGVEVAAGLLYDLSGIICTFQADRYLQLYNASPTTTYLLTESQTWRNRVQEFSALGENNFALLARTLISAVSLTDGNLTDVGGVSGGDAVVFLRAQGEMLAKIEMTADNWQFVIELLRTVTKSKKLSAIMETGDIAAFSSELSNITKTVSSALKNVGEDCIEALQNEDYSLFLAKFFGCFRDEDWQDFVRFISCAGEEQNYSTYFEKIAKTDEYSAFKQSTQSYNLSQLKAAAEDGENFINILKGYVFGVNCAFAFTVFGL